MNVKYKKITIALFSIFLSLNLYSIEISGRVTRIVKASTIKQSNKESNSDFQKICITFFTGNNGVKVALVEDYYFCSIARKYKIGDFLNEEIQDNIILDAEDIEPELHNRLQNINHESFYVIIDY